MESAGERVYNDHIRFSYIEHLNNAERAQVVHVRKGDVELLSAQLVQYLLVLHLRCNEIRY